MKDEDNTAVTMPTEFGEAGSKETYLYGIRSDSFCPMINAACNPRCVFHSAKWMYADDDLLRFDVDGDLVIPDKLVETYTECHDGNFDVCHIDLDEDVWRECQLLDIIGSLHWLICVRGRSSDRSFAEYLYELVKDMSNRDWSVQTYEQNC